MVIIKGHKVKYCGTSKEGNVTPSWGDQGNLRGEESICHKIRRMNKIKEDYERHPGRRSSRSKRIKKRE